MKQREISFFLLIMLCLLIPTGCNGQAKNVSIDGLKPGTYISGDDNAFEIDQAKLFLGENGEFTLSRNLLDSKIFVGTYTVENDTLTLHENSGNVYLFKIKDGQLIFQKESSSDLSLDDPLNFHLKEE
ncbi:hypothetical protein GND95_12025 [Defluviitalea raffinosedens]|uniref:Uncharacterized protein n=1 Tax=Defluviitalea raffinosedens TaxID=1450156 RepID=A0A7C8HDD7_9FIRM|nr:hypothetical protein [Defluviitalea raffinosedens]KAE9630644.1 hypothetical protein GND95_12025 [Defluviitalea raffinosedens]